MVGLSSVDCPCLYDGRPDSDSVPTATEWRLEVFHSGDTSGDLALTTDRDLPDDLTANSQLFENGTPLVADTDYETTGAKEITVAVASPDTVYQLWYLSSVPVQPYNEATSGLYVSDLLPPEELTGLAKCEYTVWDHYARCRDIAVKEVVASLNASVLRRNQLKNKVFSGYIGDPDNVGALTSTKTYCGVRMRTNPIRSGYIRIKRIMAQFERSGTLNVRVYAMDGTVVTPEFQIETVGGRRAFTDVGLTLPLLSDFNTSQDYFFVYEYDPANRPLLNKVACVSCNGAAPASDFSRFSTLSEWPAAFGGKLSWGNYLIAGGWQGNSVAGFSDASSTAEPYMNGLAFEVEIGCDLVAGLCGMAEGNSPETMAIATAIQRRTASLLVSRRITSSTPNRQNLVNRDQLEAEAQKWEADYAEAINYAVQSVTPQSNDCVMCRPRMAINNILT